MRSRHSESNRRVIRIGRRHYDIILRPSPSARRLTLRYHAVKDAFVLTHPRRCRTSQADAFLEVQVDWMKDVISKSDPRVRLVYGNRVPVLGRNRVIISHDENAVRYNEIRVVGSHRRCEEIVITLLKQELKDYINNMAHDLAAQIGRRIKTIYVRDTSTRWGSCSYTGALSFSWRLVFAPIYVLDYVVAHEVAHLREHNHSERFWNLVEEICPDYERARDWLTEHGRTLYRYGSSDLF